MRQKNTIKEISFEFGNVKIIGNIVIAVMNEGILFGSAYNTELISVCTEYLGNTAFGYISVRKNAYSIDPTIYLETAQVSNLCAIAVVSVKDYHKHNVTVEKQFCNQPYEVFDNLEQATDWMHNVLPTETTQKHQS
jgi:hypothetical protein